ncbi:MAG TPA: hypothetical protein VK864_04425 [Longimicrobiales bacterium]|nr:hypothetical protein [Longimicrobiales bacterium]
MAKQERPNLLVIWGEDIGWFNISAYNHGVMGYRAPNIDRVAHERAMFTDWYGQQSCTAGQRLEYGTLAGRDHGTIVRPGTPLEEPLVAWTAARFANQRNRAATRASPSDLLLPGEQGQTSGRVQ